MIALSHLATPNYKTEHFHFREGITMHHASAIEEAALQSAINPHGKRDVRTKKCRAGSSY